MNKPNNYQEVLSPEEILYGLIDEAEERFNIATDAREKIICRLKVADLNNKLCYLQNPDEYALEQAHKETLKHLEDDNYLGHHQHQLDAWDKEQCKQNSEKYT